jgi:hypothetical protein
LARDNSKARGVDRSSSGQQHRLPTQQKDMRQLGYELHEWRRIGEVRRFTSRDLEA